MTRGASRRAPTPPRRSLPVRQAVPRREYERRQDGGRGTGGDRRLTRLLLVLAVLLVTGIGGLFVLRGRGADGPSPPVASVSAVAAGEATSAVPTAPPLASGPPSPSPRSAAPVEPSGRPAPSSSPQPAASVQPTASVEPTAPAEPPASPPATVRLLAVGDVMLATTVGQRVRRDGPDSVFRRVRRLLEAGDLVVANLENAISNRGRPARKGYRFRSGPRTAQALADGSVDVVSLANNHALDYGPDALADTIRLVEAEGIATAGAGSDAGEARRATIIERNGVRIAFLGYVDLMVERSGWTSASWEAGRRRPGMAIARPDQIRRDVRRARRQADVVVVMLHAGIEFQTSPSRRQRLAAHAAVDAGAALVLGHHPHILQGTERRKGALIAYSLGNFVFDFSPRHSTDSAVLDVTLSADGVEAFRWHPVVIDDGLPRPAKGPAAERILRRVQPLD